MFVISFTEIFLPFDRWTVAYLPDYQFFNSVNNFHKNSRCSLSVDSRRTRYPWNSENGSWVTRSSRRSHFRSRSSMCKASNIIPDTWRVCRATTPPCCSCSIPWPSICTSILCACPRIIRFKRPRNASWRDGANRYYNVMHNYILSWLLLRSNSLPPYNMASLLRLSEESFLPSSCDEKYKRIGLFGETFSDQ